MAKKTKAVAMMVATTDGDQWVCLDGIPSIHAYQHSKRVADYWEAVRKAGGNPAIVAEALDALEAVTQEGQLQHMRVAEQARAVLRRAGRLS